MQAKPRNRPPLRILVAEDNVINQIVISSLLENMGQNADLAANGRQALEACRARRYDLVFMDCQMPEMDGYTASNRIRHLERKRGGKPVFIVAMTADAQNGTRAKCQEAGMDEYITKPIMTEKLQDMLFKADRREGADAAGGRPVDKETILHFEGLDLRILDRLRALSEGDEEGMFLDLVSSFLEQSVVKIGELGKMAASREFSSLAKAAHGLKGLSLNFGALAMTRTCDMLQSAAESKDGPTVLETLAQLKSAFGYTRIALSGLPGLGGQGWENTKPALAPEKGGTDV
jgi:CheY-like chemotaxis protein/HPt (histidine-containing phosphotransfer) domain-containing protein